MNKENDDLEDGNTPPAPSQEEGACPTCVFAMQLIFVIFITTIKLNNFNITSIEGKVLI